MIRLDAIREIEEHLKDLPYESRMQFWYQPKCSLGGKTPCLCIADGLLLKEAVEAAEGFAER